MSIIYSYPQITATTDDLLLVSDASSTPKYKTSQTSVSSIKDAIDVVDSLVAGSGISISAATGAVTIGNTGVLGSGTQYNIPMFATTTTLGDSLFSQDAGATTITFGTAASGQTLDISGQNKISFKGDKTNSWIAANNTNPESLEIHADDQLYLRPDGYVVIDGSGAVPTSVSDTGNQGSIVFDSTHLYIAIADDEWRRVALSTF